MKKNFQAVTAEGKSWEEEIRKILLSYRSNPHPIIERVPANMLFGTELRTALPCVLGLSQQNCPQEMVSKNVDLYKKRVKAYYDRRNHVKPHKFEVGNIVYLKGSAEKGKLDSKFGAARYVFVEFKGRDTCHYVKR